MDIEQLINTLANELKGTNALIQVHVNDTYYTRKVGDINRLDSNPTRVFVKNNSSFIIFMKNEIELLPVTKGTKDNHNSTLKQLELFNNNLSFSDITYETICQFDYFLRQKSYAINTIAKFHKIFRRYINIAIDKEIISSYPYRKFRIKTETTHRQQLTEREIKRIEGFNDMSIEGKEVRDGFLFSVYSGLRFSDIKRITKQNIKTVNRNQWLVMKMQKTGSEVRVPISRMFHGRGIEMIKSNSTTTGRLFKLPCNSRTNILLNRIVKRSNIHKHVSFHCARHTTATVLMSKGVNLPIIQHILGHRSVKTTQVYAAVTDSTIYKDIRKAFKQRYCVIR